MALAQYNRATTDYSSAVSSGSFSFDVGSGSDRSLVAIIRAYDNSSPYVSSFGTPTYNSVSMVKKAESIQTYGGGRFVGAALFVLHQSEGLASGSNTFAWSLDQQSDNGVSVELISFTGANNGIGTNVGQASGSSTSPDVTFTTTSSTGRIITGVTKQVDGTPFSPAHSETELDDGSTSTTHYWSGWLASTASSQSTGCTTAGSSTRWNIVAIELLEASGGTTPVNKDLQALWDIRALVNKDLQALWDIRALVNKDLQALWDIRALIGKDLQALWDIEGAVGKDLQLIWDILNVANKDLQAVWDIHTLVNKDIQALWDIAALVNKDLQAVWDISGAIGVSLQAVWDIYNVANKDLQAVWDILNLVNKDMQALWDIRTLATKDLQALWDIAGGVNKDLQAKWDILSDATPTRRGRVTYIIEDERFFKKLRLNRSQRKN